MRAQINTVRIFLAGALFVGLVGGQPATAGQMDRAADWLGIDKEAVADIVRDPSDLPPSVGTRGAEQVTVNLVTVERVGRLDDGSTYRYWTFNGQVPGPFVRVRVGDTVSVHVENADDSWVPHSVDFHAVTGPGGGAALTQVDPGAAASFRFKALNPASMSTTAPRRWSPITSPTACTA